MNYYNEFDPNAAAWLRELIKENLIPQGEVDERSIKDVGANDLVGFTQCHFFAGVSGWSRALRLAGWPDDKPVWTGSCPCQPFSSAGKQKGFADERDLWPEFYRLIAECRPERIFGEQVEGAIRQGWLDRVCADMESQNYAVGAVVLGAHSVGAPHIRQRLYWGAARLANNVGGRCGTRGQLGGMDEICRAESDLTMPVAESGSRGGLSDGNGQRRVGQSISNERGYCLSETAGRGAVDGLSDAGLLRQEERQQSTARSIEYSAVCRMDDSQSIGRGIYQSEDVGETTGKVNSLADTGNVCAGSNSLRLENLQCAGCRGRDNGDPSGNSRAIQVAGSGGIDGMVDLQCQGLQGYAGNGNGSNQSERFDAESAGPVAAPGVSNFSFWSRFALIYCRDDKVRRVPAESIFQRVADGVSKGMDASGNCSLSGAENGFPLTTESEARVMLLKGYGNAINPYCGAAFVQEFEQAWDR